MRSGNFVFVGGTQGVGKAAALAVARNGASILLVARDPVAGNAAANEMIEAGAAAADFVSADLSTVAGMGAAGDAIAGWRPQIHGLMHSAMSAFSKKIVTADELEFAFALQYFARAVINRKCADVLAASGDGRIVHLAGPVPYWMAKPDLDDLQFEHRKWTFFKAILTTHVLGFMFLDEAARRWEDKPITLHAAAIGTTKTKVMTDPDMHWIMRLLAIFGTSPEKSAQNAVSILLSTDPPKPRMGLIKSRKKFKISPFKVPQGESEQLWNITTALGTKFGVVLP